MAYLHDIGMVAATPAGRRVHAQFAAHTALGEGFDDLAEELWRDDVVGLRERIESDALADGPIPGDLVMREVLALSLCHSKSVVPAHLLDDPAALRAVMLRGTFTALDQQMAAPREALWRPGFDGSAPAAVAARYRDVGTEAFAWMVDPRPAARRFVADVVDAVRVLRAADALRQRGTTQRTSAGYEICVDRRSGRAVMAVRSADRRFGALMWLDKHHSVAEGNLRVVDLTDEGSLRIAFHRGELQRRRSDRTGRDGDRGDDRRHRGGRARQLPPRAGRTAIGAPRGGRRSAGQPGLRAARRRGARTRPPAHGGPDGARRRAPSHAEHGGRRVVPAGPGPSRSTSRASTSASSSSPAMGSTSPASTAGPRCGTCGAHDSAGARWCSHPARRRRSS